MNEDTWMEKKEWLFDKKNLVCELCVVNEQRMCDAKGWQQRRRRGVCEKRRGKKRSLSLLYIFRIRFLHQSKADCSVMKIWLRSISKLCSWMITKLHCLQESKCWHVYRNSRRILVRFPFFQCSDDGYQPYAFTKKNDVCYVEMQ